MESWNEKVERYGLWNGIPVYKIERKKWIEMKYYDDVAYAYWIVDDGNRLIYKNRVKGTIIGNSLSDTCYDLEFEYYKPNKIKVEPKPMAVERSAADIILGGVYTTKLWDEI